MPKISAKFHQDHPLRGCQIQVGWVKIGDFRQTAGYISKTVAFSALTLLVRRQEGHLACKN